MTEQPQGNRRRTREEIRAGYRVPSAPLPPPPIVVTLPKQSPSVAQPIAPEQPTQSPASAASPSRPQPDPEPIHPLPQQPPIVPEKPKQPKPNHKPKTDPSAPAVSINIQLPSLDIKKRFKQGSQLAGKPFAAAIKHRQLGLVIVGGIIVVAGAGGGWIAYQKHQTNTSQGSAAGTAAGGAVATQAVAAKPTFTPVVPATKPELGEVGKQSAFDGNHNVYSYIDSINKQRVTVSEQQPAAGSTAADSAQKAGQSLNANKTVATSNGDIYINTNTKYGSQTVVASVKNLLIFMQSSQTFGDADWKTYVESLQ